MSDEPVEPGPAPSFPPLLRLLGAVVIGVALVQLALGVWFNLVLEPIRDPSVDPLAYDDQELSLLWLSVISMGSQGASLFGHATTAGLMVLLARRGASGLRPAAGLGSVAAVASFVALVFVLVANVDPSPEAYERLGPWYVTSAVARVVVAGSMLALVMGSRVSPSVRRAAMIATGVGVLASLVMLIPTLTRDSIGPESAWHAHWLHISVRGWILLLQALASGIGLWLASRPDDSSSEVFDRVAARGLRLARTAVWWRVIVAVVAVVLVIAGTVSMQKAASSAMFGGGPTIRELPVTLKAAPWFGYVEAMLGVLLVVGLAAAVLQRRSKLGAALVALGVVLLMGGVAISMGLNSFFHDLIVKLGSPGGGFGDGLRDYAEFSAKLDPPLRWLGIAGIGSVLGGLIAVARQTGHPSPRRAIRFVVLVAVFTGGWLYGREALAELGTGVFLLAPVVIVGAIWALLDLTTFLAEVAEGLEGEIPSSP